MVTEQKPGGPPRQKNTDWRAPRQKRNHNGSTVDECAGHSKENRE